MRNLSKTHLYNSYFLSPFYYIFFFSVIKISIMSEIHIIIDNQGNQPILNDNFYKDPTDGRATTWSQGL